MNKKLFPPPLELDTSYTEISEFRETFRHQWKKISRCFFKLERLQNYEEPTDNSYKCFLDKDLEGAKRELEIRIHNQIDLYKSIFKKSADLVRVRIVDFPISDYLKYEFISYKISALYGEKILIVNSEKIPSLLEDNISDFLLFDNQLALVHDYDLNGLQRGGWKVSDPDMLENYQNLKVELITASEPLGAFLRNNKDL